MIRTGKNAYIEDAQSPDYVDHVIARDVGFRHMLGVPTRVGGTVWVIIVLTFKSGKKPGPAYVAMVETFAEQAGIGIANASLFAQTQAARACEQASVQILQVINEATSDLQPMFDLIVKKAAELCDASFCMLDRFEGEQ